MAKTVQGRSHKMDVSQPWDTRTYTVSCNDCGKDVFKVKVKDYVQPQNPSDGVDFLEDMGCDLESYHQSYVCRRITDEELIRQGRHDLVS